MKAGSIQEGQFQVSPKKKATHERHMFKYAIALFAFGDPRDGNIQSELKNKTRHAQT
jgi:hypothetical protein